MATFLIATKAVSSRNDPIRQQTRNVLLEPAAEVQAISPLEAEAVLLPDLSPRGVSLLAKTHGIDALGSSKAEAQALTELVEGYRAFAAAAADLESYATNFVAEQLPNNNYPPYWHIIAWYCFHVAGGTDPKLALRASKTFGINHDGEECVRVYEAIKADKGFTTRFNAASDGARMCREKLDVTLHAFGIQRRATGDPASTSTESSAPVATGAPSSVAPPSIDVHPIDSQATQRGSAMSKTLWLTYAWDDNRGASAENVDFIIQELEKTGLKVRLDRRALVPGQRLWPQIADNITSPTKCDGWGIVLTPASLKSAACVEELCYALDRALESRDQSGTFPLFALMHGVAAADMPKALKIRLCIPLAAKDWAQQVVAAMNGTAPSFIPSGLTDFIVRQHISDGLTYIEIAPRFATITPFLVAVDKSEKDSGNVVNVLVGPPNAIPQRSVMMGNSIGNFTHPDGTETWFTESQTPASPTNSFYLVCKRKPRRLWFGPTATVGVCDLK